MAVWPYKRVRDEDEYDNSYNSSSSSRSSDGDATPELPHHFTPAWSSRQPRKTSRLAISAVALAVLIVLLEVAHYTVPEDKVPETLRKHAASVASTVSSWTSPLLSDSGNDDEDVEKLCNPYDYPGVLNISPEAQENVYRPILAPAGCDVNNYMLGLIRNETAVDFARNKVVVMFGDSIDRNLNSDICGLTGGKRIMVPSTSPLSPPYPKGREHPPADYVNKVSGDNTQWADHGEGRPWLCHWANQNLLLVNVFHYGFRDETAWIRKWPHYYPPARIEDRFDEVIVPLLERIADEFGVSSVPDIVTFTPGFWTIKRTQYDQLEGVTPVEGEPSPSASEVGDWDPENMGLVDWLTERVQQTVSHIGRGYAHLPADERPLILWRPLPQIPGNGEVTHSHAHSLDQLSLSVIQRLQEEGRAAKSANEWEAWSRRAESTPGWIGHSREEALDMDLGERLVISRWAEIIAAAKGHQRDAIHPDVLPAGQLYGNMLLHLLKMLDYERSA